jgi:hypothetical protein
MNNNFKSLLVNIFIEFLLFVIFSIKSFNSIFESIFLQISSFLYLNTFSEVNDVYTVD